MLDRPAINRGPMLRYIFLSVFALLLLTACGDGRNGQLGGKVTDNDSQPTKSDTSGVGKDVAQFLGHSIPKSCHECNLRMADLSGAKLSRVDLSGTQLYMANLSGADLSGANLTEADFFGANLDGVIGADLSGALNVPPRYR